VSFVTCESGIFIDNTLLRRVCVKNCLLLLLMFNCTVSVRAQVAAKPETLTAVGESIAAMKGQALTMDLRLRNIDRVMEKIWFYDKENVDVVFDITGFLKNPVLVSSMADAHPGVVYRVMFTPESVMQQGTLEGRLQSFSPVFLDKIK
jgi:hypothetical protein